MLNGVRDGYLPEGYPAVPLWGWTQADVDHLVETAALDRMTVAKHWMKALDLVGFVEASSQVNVNFRDWCGNLDDPWIDKFGMYDLIQDALKQAARDVNQELKNQRERHLADLKADQMQATPSVLGPTNVQSHMTQVFR